MIARTPLALYHRRWLEAIKIDENPAIVNELSPRRLSLYEPFPSELIEEAFAPQFVERLVHALA